MLGTLFIVYSTCSGLDCTAYVLANHKLWEGETTNSSDVSVSGDRHNYSAAKIEGGVTLEKAVVDGTFT